MLTLTAVYGACKAIEYARDHINTSSYHLRSSTVEEKKKNTGNLNPFDGVVDEDVFIGDGEGNIIPVPEGHQLEGTRDGKWIQVKDKDKFPTGTRKDGGGHPREKDVRGREPHGHIPGITNPDGTPWLPIY